MLYNDTMQQHQALQDRSKVVDIYLFIAYVLSIIISVEVGGVMLILLTFSLPSSRLIPSFIASQDAQELERLFASGAQLIDKETGANVRVVGRYRALLGGPQVLMVQVKRDSHEYCVCAYVGGDGGGKYDNL